MDRDYVMTEPKHLVQIELKNAGFDVDNIEIPKRVFLLADSTYDAMLEKECGTYKYPLGGKLYVFNANSNVGFIKSKMCSPGIAIQAEDLIAGGVKELIHVGFAGVLQPSMNIGEIIVTDGAYNDTAVARLYGFDYDFIETSKTLTDELAFLLKNSFIEAKRGKHWTTDAGYRETWGQVLDYRTKGALCVEMEGVGLFTIGKYRKCTTSAIYIVTDILDEKGWSLGWQGNEIKKSVDKIIDMIIDSVKEK
ncbi:nucleoside phosphorylase [Clostridium cellulovorans]|uniref:Purine or other phosphorylase family 1 n=1 Tax=Clostridium cellulovorans (strain ATCC 35296 / DSM 3052 / OCM 3 / 743B) TaxID=573061 RepID=D9SX28_CLOC7|nr:nucleoside phosphorylase [Clostridium cellulovorans]ADL51389.1 purine or other phosphorylase family 1 [Clostridium cellulovorans 743B]